MKPNEWPDPVEPEDDEHRDDEGNLLYVANQKTLRKYAPENRDGFDYPVIDPDAPEVTRLEIVGMIDSWPDALEDHRLSSYVSKHEGQAYDVWHGINSLPKDPYLVTSSQYDDCEAKITYIDEKTILVPKRHSIEVN